MAFNNLVKREEINESINNRFKIEHSTDGVPNNNRTQVKPIEEFKREVNKNVN